MTIAEIIELLEDLQLERSELDALSSTLATDGLTEAVRRKVLAVFVRELGTKHEKVSRYERALDALRECDAQIEQVTSASMQTLNRLDQQTMAQFDTLERRISEDVSAARAGRRCYSTQMISHR